MASPSFPYRRDLRPLSADGVLGEHTDRQFEKIETVISAFEARLTSLEARLKAAHIP